MQNFIPLLIFFHSWNKELEYEILKQVNQQNTDVVLEIEKLNNTDNYDLPIQCLWKG